MCGVSWFCLLLPGFHKVFSSTLTNIFLPQDSGSLPPPLFFFFFCVPYPWERHSLPSPQLGPAEQGATPLPPSAAAVAFVLVRAYSFLRLSTDQSIPRRVGTVVNSRRLRRNFFSHRVRRPLGKDLGCMRKFFLDAFCCRVDFFFPPFDRFEIRFLFV